ncbi:hypothetical protein JDV02_004225 [Purpureocillium takamizusanense]|uniref:Uncharacterized protein n=1 Tax=Purpureocillium takamizusanense TaxID=2060973 RepID=A0A9Q8QDC7_9HYPO|nr:uncharacterized protein JDV02_004225 [Purpureocillium takamizusanense]UNI17918.1 hypothetical protein JDV02_004225 [Purpureocillium takamizusanense]
MPAAIADQDAGGRQHARDRSPPAPAAASTVKAIIADQVTGTYSVAQRSLDRVVPPSSRRHAYDAASALASSRPILFSFLLAQVCFSLLPLLLFTLFCASAVGFALATGLLFTLFWVGVALFALVPTLLLTSSVAALMWAWALSAFLVARWLYSHAPPGVTGRQAQAPVKSVSLKEEDLDNKVEPARN